MNGPIRTQAGLVTGMTIEEGGQPVGLFAGIPYAAPPVGALRWRPPQAPAPWDGVRPCVAFSRAAPQAIGKLQISLAIPQSEDCLYLNVLTPARDAAERLPVMVWLHGGAYIHGNGNEAFYNAPRLPSQGVVLVTVNMRIGPFGLLAHPALDAESPRGVSGNYMVLDMVAALAWIRDNIAAFGGGPANVTIFGESGGGGKVLALMCSALATGLFHKAIIESGGVRGTLNGRKVAEQHDLGGQLLAELGIGASADPLPAVRALPWEAIIAADRALVQKRGLSIARWNTTIDGWVLAASAWDLIATGQAPNWVPVIAGCNLGEIDGTALPYITYPSLIEANVNVASRARQKGHESFVYLFDRVPPGWRKGGCVSFHRLEPGYVFGDWDDRYGFFSSDALPLARGCGAQQDDPELDDVDRAVSRAMMALWTQFARTGNPNAPGRTDWPAYEPAAGAYLFIGDRLASRSGYASLPG